MIVSHETPFCLGGAEVAPEADADIKTDCSIDSGLVVSKRSCRRKL